MTLPKGVGSALLAAVLFGASTPVAKFLLGDVAPVLLAGLFYAGSGLGLAIVLLCADGWRRETQPRGLGRSKRICGGSPAQLVLAGLPGQFS